MLPNHATACEVANELTKITDELVYITGPNTMYDETPEDLQDLADAIRRAAERVELLAKATRLRNEKANRPT